MKKILNFKNEQEIVINDEMRLCNKKKCEKY